MGATQDGVILGWTGERIIHIPLLAALQSGPQARSRPATTLRQSEFDWRSLKTGSTKRKLFATSNASNIATRITRSPAFGSNATALRDPAGSRPAV
jgi:hypothetical protein